MKGNRILQGSKVTESLHSQARDKLNHCWQLLEQTSPSSIEASISISLSPSLSPLLSHSLFLIPSLSLSHTHTLNRSLSLTRSRTLSQWQWDHRSDRTQESGSSQHVSSCCQGDERVDRVCLSTSLTHPYTASVRCGIVIAVCDLCLSVCLSVCRQGGVLPDQI